ncbi:MAG: hypothetical protein ACOC45_02035 [Alkalispirochaetaceae bacterium]
MKRKLILAAVLLLLAGASPLFAQFRGATRLGLAFGVPNGVLVYRPSPFEVKLGYDFTEGNEYVFLSGDLRLVDNRQIVGVLHGSFGIGLYGKLYPEGRDSEGSPDFDGGSRIPFALSVLLLDDFLEFFVEAAPGIDLYPKAQFADQPLQLFAGFTIDLL